MSLVDKLVLTREQICYTKNKQQFTPARLQVFVVNLPCFSLFSTDVIGFRHGIVPKKEFEHKTHPLPTCSCTNLVELSGLTSGQKLWNKNQQTNRRRENQWTDIQTLNSLSCLWVKTGTSNQILHLYPSCSCTNSAKRTGIEWSDCLLQAKLQRYIKAKLSCNSKEELSCVLYSLWRQELEWESCWKCSSKSRQSHSWVKMPQHWCLRRKSGNAFLAWPVCFLPSHHMQLDTMIVFSFTMAGQNQPGKFLFWCIFGVFHGLWLQLSTEATLCN